MVTKQLTVKLNATQKELNEVKNSLGGLPETIKSQKEYLVATDLASLMAMRIKNATTACKFFTDPLTAQVKDVKAQFNSIIEPAEQLLVAVKERMKTFYISEQARLDEEQKKIEASAMSNATPEQENISVPVVNDIKTQAGNFGSSTARKVQKWRVMDETMIPAAYMMPNDAEITKAMRQGLSVAGVEYYFDVVMATRTK